MAAIWRGTVSFGLVSIPVKLHSATEERGVSFRQVHEADGGRIRYKRVCTVDGEEVPYSDIVKGYELPDGDVVILTDDDLASLPLPSRHAIEVLQFVPAEQIDGLYFSKGYYLAAEGPGVKPYVLLRQALERAGRVALVKVALRNRESLAVLRAREGALVVQTMLWPDEIRDAAAYAPGEDVEVRDQEVAMAESYIATLSEDFDPGAYTDDYRAALDELIQAKAGGRELAEPSEGGGPAGGTVVDLMAALRASVEAARERRESGAGADPAAAEAAAAGEPAIQPAAKKAARKAPGQRQPAAEQKPAAAKSPAKKAPAKKAPAKPAATQKAPAKGAAKKASTRKSA